MEVWQVTAAGAGVSRDSVDYLSSAQSIARGHGATIPYPSYNELPPKNFTAPTEVPLTSFPPLFPSLIAGAAVLAGQPAIDVARVMNALALSLTLLLAGALVWRLSGSVLWSLVAMAALLFQRDLILVHSMVWSEPWAIVLIVASLFALTEYVRAPRLWLLVFAAVLTAAAIMERYVAVALVPVALLAVAFAHPRTRPWYRAVLFSTIAIGPVLLWLVRDLVQANGVMHAQAGWHPPAWSAVSAAIQTLYGWLSPLQSARAPALAVLAALTLVLAALRIRRGAPILDHRILLIAAAAASCVIVLAVTWFFFDAALGVDYRVLSPLYVVGVVLVTSAIGSLVARWRSTLRVAMWAPVMALCVVSLLRELPAVPTLSSQFAYTAAPWLASPTLDAASRLPAGDLIVTNAPDFMWFRERLDTIAEPRLYFAVSKLPNPNYRAEVAAITGAVSSRGHGWLVLWDGVSRPYLPSLEEVSTQLHLRLTARTSDGDVFELLPP